MRTAGVAVLADAAEIIKSCLFLGKGRRQWRVRQTTAYDIIRGFYNACQELLLAYKL